MTDLLQSLEPRLFAAATALANRRQDRPRPDILQFLTVEGLARVVDEARACLNAAALADLKGLARTRRSPRDLLGLDAATLGLALNAHGLVILARDADHQVSGAYWARGVFEHATPYASAALAPVWLAATQVLHPPAGVRAGSPSPAPEQP